jgi:hypothetical protein
MLKIGIIFGAVVLYKFVTNLVRFLRCKFLLKEYGKYLEDRGWDMVQHQEEVIGLFKKAGIKDSVVPYVEPVGMGQMISTTVSVFSNFTRIRADIAGTITSNFHRAIGVYKKRMLNSFNPLFWIDFVVNLPREALEYVGVPPEKSLVKVAQVIYWALGVLASVISALFKPEIVEAIKLRLGL